MIYQPLPIGRVCKHCKQWFPEAKLKKNRTSADGVVALCLDCHNLRSKQRYDQQRDEILEKERQRRKDNPQPSRERDRARDSKPERRRYKREYSKQYYWDNREASLARSSQYFKDHPEVYRKSSKKWAAANRDKVNAKSRRYNKRHPENAAKHVKLSRQRHPETKRASEERRRARKRNLPDTFTVDEHRRMMKYFKGCCAVCGRPAGLWHTIAIDHWIPLSNPNCPGTVATNMIPLCHSQRLGDEGCNNTKWSFDPIEWLNKRLEPTKAKATLKRIQDYFEWVKSQD